ncbi:MAG TPA: hypothetical protein VL463_28240 [Kofleriaceae bacterium]|nr:hypothetical protein [Kofleriaceae bacterium]
MTDTDRLRVMLEDGMERRKNSSTSFANGLAVFAVIMTVVVLIKDPSAWWILLCTAPLCLLALVPKGRHDGAVRDAVLDHPDEVVEITHHRGRAFANAHGGRGVVTAAMKNASRDLRCIWIVTKRGERAALHFDHRSGKEAIELLAARCPHVTVEYGLPEKLTGLTVLPEKA